MNSNALDDVEKIEFKRILAVLIGITEKFALAQQDIGGKDEN